MSIEDGAPAPVVNINFDPSPITNAINAGFANQRPQQQQQPMEDAMTGIYRTLKDKGWDDDAIQAHLVSADLTKREIINTVMQQLGNQNSGSAVEQAERLVARELRAYCKDEPKLARLTDQMKSDIYKKYNADQGRMNALSKGRFDETALEGFIDEVVGEMREVVGLDKGSKKGSPLPTRQSSGRSDSDDESIPDRESGDPLSGLNEHQEEFYNTRSANLVRYQNKTVKEAHEIAIKAARGLTAPSLRKR